MAFVLLAGALAFVIRVWRMGAVAQEAVVSQIASRGGVVVFDYQQSESGTVSRWAPDIMVELLGPHYFANVVEVRFEEDNAFPTQVTDRDLELVAALSSLRTLVICHGRKVTDDGIRSICHLPELRKLDLTLCTGLTDKALAHIGESRKLERLVLCGTSVGDAGLTHLHRLPNLVEVDAYDTNVTASGAAELESRMNAATVYLD